MFGCGYAEELISCQAPETTDSRSAHLDASDPARTGGIALHSGTAFGIGSLTSEPPRCHTLIWTSSIRHDRVAENERHRGNSGRLDWNGWIASDHVARPVCRRTQR